MLGKNFFILKYKSNDVLNINDILNLKGQNNENRKFHKSNIGMMFGNFALSEWFYFLKDIAENGLKNPIHLIKKNNSYLKSNSSF